MNIPVNHLKKFQKIASHIKSNGILPIHSYIKFGCGAICKNTGTAFVNYNLVEANEEILVDENDLFSLVNQTAASVVSISIKKGKVELWDGRDKIVSQTVKYTLFGNPVPASKERIELSPEFIDAVEKASHFSQLAKDLPTHYGYVHVGEKTVCSGDGIIAFHCPVEENMKIVIDSRVAQTISKHNILSFGESDNSYYFYSEDAVFGFSKSEVGWFDIRRIFAQSREYAFTLEASDPTSFNSLSRQLSKTALVTISAGKIEMNDSELDKYHERPLDNVKIQEPFNYNPDRMNALIEGLGLEELDFSDSKPAYYVSSKDTRATAIIAKIKYP
jgi:hypothetical protein